MNHIRKSFTSQFSKDARGHRINLENTLPQETKSFLDCEYFLKCQELNAKCKSPCQLYSFFNKYGFDNYLSLGVGA